MFTAARYVVVDDELTELTPLVEALHGLGTPCIGIHWRPEKLPAPELLRGLRILFTDLHLTKGHLPPKAHYDTIATMLHGAIQPGRGPYIVVLWTSHEEERQDFTDRLSVVLPPEKLPLAVLGLDKNKYREGETFSKVDELEKDVIASLAGNAQLQTLLSWEQDVLTAADATLAQIGGLIPAKFRTINDLPAALDGVLSLLAKAALGANAEADPRRAVSQALAPLLMDRIANQSSDSRKEDLWKSAVTFPVDTSKLTPDQCAQMNAMVHIALPNVEHIDRKAWGAVLPLKDAPAEIIEAYFGSSTDQIAADAFQLKPGQEGCRLVLVRIGAVCDYAQGKNGPVPYVLGLLGPAKYEKLGKSSPAELTSPFLQIGDKGGLDRLVINPRYIITLTSSVIALLPEPIFRVREQLLVTLVAHCSTHVVRPGILSFAP